MASGHYLNVRSFPLKKFYQRDPDDHARKKTWYYCPQALSEYKLSTLDVAQRVGKLELVRSGLGDEYASPLFSGAQPSTVSWKEPDAFRHYLDSLHIQVAAARKPSFDETMLASRTRLDAAEKLLRELHREHVRGGDRDFLDRVEVNRAALHLHDRARGPLLRRKW